jgi:hypothetical protein
MTLSPGTKVPPDTARHLVIFLQHASASELTALEQAIFSLRMGARAPANRARAYREAAYEQVAEVFPSATDCVRQLLARDGR